MGIKISKERYNEFLKHYTWLLIKSPDYRLGQAFLNYFPEISSCIINDTDEGTIEELRLYNETNPTVAQEKINRWIEK